MRIGITTSLDYPELCGGFAIPRVFGPVTGHWVVPLTPKKYPYGHEQDPTDTKPSSRS